MSDINLNDTYDKEPLKIDFSQIVVPNEHSSSSFIKEDFTDVYVGGNATNDAKIADSISNGNVSFGNVSTAYSEDRLNYKGESAKYVNDANSNVTYLTGMPQVSTSSEPKEYKTAGNVFANTPTTTTKSSATELQRVVQKLEKLEKMINPNSKKSLILWEEDNSFKNLMSSIVSYANTCDTEDEFPIELFDRLKALGEDVSKQIIDGKAKIKELEEQAKINTALGGALSSAYISATAGLPREEYEAGLTHPEIASFKEQLGIIASCSPDSEEYAQAEKDIKSKINNLENSVHVTIDLERTTSKGGALEYIQKEVTPSIERLEKAYEAKNALDTATYIDGEEAITALTVKKSFAEKVYDTFVRPIANLFKRKGKAK